MGALSPQFALASMTEHILIVPGVADCDGTALPLCEFCGCRFRNLAAKHLHQRKSHFNGSLSSGKDKRTSQPRPKVSFFCPLSDCRRSKEAKKVHGDRSFLCSFCGFRRFSLLRDLRYHEGRCRFESNSACNSAESSIPSIGSSRVSKRLSHEMGTQCNRAVMVDKATQCDRLDADNLDEFGRGKLGDVDYACRDDPLLTSTFCQTYLPVSDASVGTSLLSDFPWDDYVNDQNSHSLDSRFSELTNSETQTDFGTVSFDFASFLNSTETQTPDDFIL
uniref:C2H2-type domain-containing protein n=1 Tax=Trichuris muris TaxID=70415 RepID=A0A5S6R4I8_TRIMR